MNAKPSTAGADAENDTAQSKKPAEQPARLPEIDERTLNSVRILRETPYVGTAQRPKGSDQAYLERVYQRPARKSGPIDLEPTLHARFLGSTLREFMPPVWRSKSARGEHLEETPNSQASPVTLRPRRRSTYGVLLLSAALGIGGVLAARLPVHGSRSARGVLLGGSALRALSAPSAGVVRELGVATGDRVKPGQLLLALDPVDARAELTRLEETFARLEQRKLEQQRRESLQEDALRALRTQQGVLQRRFDDANLRLSQLRTQRRTYQRLLEAGVTYTGSLDELTEQVKQLGRDALVLEQDLANNKLQQLDLEQTRAEQREALQAELGSALARRHSLEAQVEHSHLVAVEASRVDKVLTRLGERVEAGQALLHLRPREPLTRAVLELPDHEHIQLRAGAAAHLHVREPGQAALSLTGRIAAVTRLPGKPAASPDGATRARLRVEVQLRLSVAEREQLGQLLPGTPVTAALQAAPRQLLEVAIEEGRAFAATL